VQLRTPLLDRAPSEKPPSLLNQQLNVFSTARGPGSRCLVAGMTAPSATGERPYQQRGSVQHRPRLGLHLSMARIVPPEWPRVKTQKCKKDVTQAFTTTEIWPTSGSMSQIDSLTMSAPWTREMFGGVQPTKRSGRKEPNNDHCGSRLPPGLSTNCFCGYRNRELQLRRLEHPESAEKFRRELAAQGKRVRGRWSPCAVTQPKGPS
jgi:hypothetical protein